MQRYDETNIIFETMHGSRLYGLHSPDSDWDVFQVVRTGHKTRQFKTETARERYDIVQVPLDIFLRGIDSGIPQHIEALFSRRKYWHDELYRPMIDNLRPNIPNAHITFARTIKKFKLSNNPKKVKAALRLELQLEALLRDGYFNPELTKDQKRQLTLNFEIFGADK